MVTIILAWRAWTFIFPWLLQKQDAGWRGFSLKTFIDFVRAAWRRADKRGCRGVPLPVIQKVDSPCEGCGARCCTMPAGESGFITVHLHAWEGFVNRHQDIVKRSDAPGDFYFDFVDGRCPFLTAGNLCSVYDHRPVACVQFNCVDGLHGYFSCAATFIRNVPTVKERLLKLGFKDRQNT